MSTNKTLNSQVTDQRNERHKRDINTGRLEVSQQEAHAAHAERGDARRHAGGPGAPDKTKATGHTEAEADAKKSGKAYVGRNPG